VNARVGSKRLPNKHLKVIKNEPLLSILLTRLISRLEEFSYGIDLTILLTTGKQEENQILGQIASKAGLNTFLVVNTTFLLGIYKPLNSIILMQ
jgi:spore coat polysaccharide biosynthesis protein SpsF (cytidylyltransferase family)